MASMKAVGAATAPSDAGVALHGQHARQVLTQVAPDAIDERLRGGDARTDGEPHRDLKPGLVLDRGEIDSGGEVERKDREHDEDARRHDEPAMRHRPFQQDGVNAVDVTIESAP